MLAKSQVEGLYLACKNRRDRLLIHLLWETGMCIGEALALWLEDFEIDGRRIHIHDRGELPNLAEIKTVASPRTLDVTIDLINEFISYVSVFHTESVNTNHVFIKISGPRTGEPMDYGDVRGVFTRLSHRAGIRTWPHLLRHTSLNGLRRAGWTMEQIAHRAGHKSIQTTYRFYTHPTDEELHENWSSIEDHMRFNGQTKERHDA